MTTNPCGDCHNCCKDTLVRVKDSDIKRWEEEKRYDILICVDKWVDNSMFIFHRENVPECIFLKPGFGCQIHETRPETCKKFPLSESQKKLYKCRL